ncbi:PIN domain-containing protein [Enterovibrio sp. Hal110]
MIRILLDTNILHQEGLNSTRFQVLKRLINNGSICLIVPEIVIKEYKSKKIEQANEDLKKIQTAIDSLNRKSVLDKDSYQVNSFSGLIESSIAKIDQVVDSWIKDNKILVPLISETSIDELFTSYFSGTGAFRIKKQREDIPDAVIYDCITRLAKSEKLIVVAKDNVLTNSVRSIDGVEVRSDLKDILNIPEVKTVLDALNKNEMEVNSIIEALSASNSEFYVSEYVKENHLLEFRGFYDDDFVELPYELEQVALANYEVHVTDLIEVFVDSPTYLGDGLFSYSLVADCKAVLSFNCENDVYESLPYEYRKALSKSEFAGENEVLVKGDVNVHFQGVLVLRGIDTNFEAAELKVHLSYLGSDRSEIECEGTLEKLEVQSIY